MKKFSRMETQNSKSFVILMGLLFVSSSLTAQTEAELKTLTNGVIIHTSQGVEKLEETKTTDNSGRTIDQWSLEECEWALETIANKMAIESSEERRLYYKEQFDIVKTRVELLKKNN